MTGHRTLMVFGFSCALISAGGLGAGIVAMQPVLDAVLEPGHQGLPQIVGEWNSEENGILGGRLSQEFIDGLPAGPFQAVVWMMGFLALLTCVGSLANFLHQFCALTIVHRTIATIRREAYGRVLHLPLRTVVEEGPSDAISRVVNDTEMLSLGFIAMLSKAIAQTTKGVAALIAAFVIHWQLALSAIVVMPLLAVVIRKLGKRIRRASTGALTARAGLFRAATESLQGLRVVKVHTTERYEAGRFGRINKEMLRQQLRIRTARAIASPLIELLTVLTLGTLMILSAKLILDGNLDKSVFFATLTALGIAAASIKPLTGLLNDMQASRAAADRIKRLIDNDTEPGHDLELPKLTRHHASLVFDNVSMTYPGQNRPAIDGVSLSIPHGETVAFVGPNGCGKTTLLSMVPRLFEPDIGRLLIDDTDIAKVRVRSLRRQIGVVTQEVVLFKGTIRENIAYGAPDASDADIVEAARQARAGGFIEQMPQGYETPVGEQGLTLSGGQRQRIAIARAILRNPEILILDEATSMVDSESEEHIAAVLEEFCATRTTLIVAHRMRTVLSADRIVVMDSGRVVDNGTHQELMDRCGLYRQLATSRLASLDRTPPVVDAG
ncbi:MAG: ABC transporter ATP-binding protein [Planctomycetota bacterium]